MKLAKIALNLCTVFFLTGGALAYDPELFTRYCAAYAVSYEAAHNCTGMRQNTTQLILMMTDAGITDGDDNAVAAEFARIKPDIQRAFQNLGRDDWCSKAWDVWGRQGFQAIAR